MIAGLIGEVIGLPLWRSSCDFGLYEGERKRRERREREREKREREEKERGEEKREREERENEESKERERGEREEERDCTVPCSTYASNNAGLM